MSDPAIKGWCPGAHRPMMSGDGLVVRLRPRLGRLDVETVGAVCDLAQRFGSGMIDVTSRANLQLRGVAEKDHAKLLAGLVDLGVVDGDPVLDGRRNVVASPFWKDGDLTARLGLALEARLTAFPEMPAKIGYALDTGARPMLRDVPADFRVEAVDGALVVYADGADRGVAVSEGEVVGALEALAQWFVGTGGRDGGRVARHVAKVAWPEAWDAALPKVTAETVQPGNGVVGVPFGQVEAAELESLVTASGATHLRVLPWRMLWLEGGSVGEHPGFVTAPDDPLLEVNACPGAPFCPQASVGTRDLARRLAGRWKGGLHVSGCAKGCARQSAAEMTLVGCGGAFDVIRDGTTRDAPQETGLSEAEICRRWLA